MECTLLQFAGSGTESVGSGSVVNRRRARSTSCSWTTCWATTTPSLRRSALLLWEGRQQESTVPYTHGATSESSLSYSLPNTHTHRDTELAPRLSLVSPKVFFSILSPMEFWFLAAVTSGLLSWGHFISSDIVDLIEQKLFKLSWAGQCHHWIQ